MATSTLSEKDIRALTVSEENYLLFEFSYDHKVILPFTDGLKLLDALKRAETYSTRNYTNPIILPYKGETQIHVISRKRYTNIKMAGLLNITLEELEKQQEQGASNDPLTDP